MDSGPSGDATASDGAGTLDGDHADTNRDDGGLATDGGLDVVLADAAVDTGVDASVFDSALPDSSSSPIEAFEIIYNGAIQTPLSCPTSHWEFAIPASSSVALRNVGSVPLPYIAEPSGYIGGVQYTPGVPTSQQEEEVGVLAPGDFVNLALGPGGGNTIAAVGSSKAFSIYDGGFAAADEWTVSWPLGVTGSGGATTMYVADIEWDSTCSPVRQP